MIGVVEVGGLEAKRKLGIYKDDQTGWLKLKNPTYSQAEGRVLRKNLRRVLKSDRPER
jgi:hypothetical protein